MTIDPWASLYDEPAFNEALAALMDAVLLKTLEDRNPILCKTIRGLVNSGEPREKIASAIGKAAPPATLTYHACILFLDREIGKAAGNP